MPFLNGGNETWLQQAVASFKGQAKVLVLRNDGEMAEAMNKGLEEADTEFVLMFGADDIAEPGYVDTLLGPAWNADVVYPRMTLVSEDLSTFLGDFMPAPFDGKRLLDMNFVSGASLVRRSKALEVGGWRQLETLEDWDLFVRIYRAGGRFKPCPEARMFYRQVEGSLGKFKDAEQVERLKRQIVGDGDPLEDVLATFYHQATPATTYLRCQLPARYLPGVVREDFAVAYNDEGDVRFPEHRGAAVMQFASDAKRAVAAELMKNQGVRLLVEVDDNYLINPGRAILDRQGWAMKMGDGSFTRAGHRWIAEKADGIIATTPWLAAQYRHVNENVFVCPNTVDPPDWPDPVKPDDGVLRIVWFASQSHEGDLPLIAPAYRWAAEQKDVEVYLVNLNPFESQNKAIRLRWKKVGFNFIPWIPDLDAYRAMFSRFDIGVAPVMPTDMGLARSDVKALEMAMGLQAPVLSDVAPYDGVGGRRELSEGGER
jgi:hypothetical protein